MCHFAVLSVNSGKKEINVFVSLRIITFLQYCLYDISGGFVLHKKHGDAVKKEKVVRIVSFSTDKDFEQNKNKLFEQIEVWAKKWGQEYIGYEYEEDLYYIPK